MLIRSFTGFGLLVLLAAQAAAQVTPPAVLTPTDPELRFWLKSDAGLTLGTQAEGLPGPPVLQWQDQSQYGTILAPRTESNPNGPIGGFPVEEQPHIVTSTLNGRSFTTVQFDRDGDIFETGDPAVDGSGSTDRLYQTNNLASQSAFDPLDIGDGKSLTTFVVFNPTNTTTPGIGFQSVFAKRGSSSSAYSLQIKNFTNFGQFELTSYDAVEQYLTGNKPTEKVWHTFSQIIEDQPGNENVDLIRFMHDESQSDATKMVDVGVRGANGSTVVTTIASRTASTPEPFALGGHSQNCCGEGETFSGNIAEIIIFARLLTPQEYSDVENYLDAKYFAAIAGTPGDYNSDGFVDAADYTVFRDHLGSSLTLPNENPAAVTPGLVDDEDFAFWKTNFGNGGGAIGATGVVPEPTSLTLVGMGMLIGFASRRRR
jgi:hypothetical protein